MTLTRKQYFQKKVLYQKNMRHHSQNLVKNSGDHIRRRPHRISSSPDSPDSDRWPWPWRHWGCGDTGLLFREIIPSRGGFKTRDQGVSAGL